MRNYLLRRSYASEALRTIDTPCEQYPRVKQLSKTLSKVDTKKTAVEQKRLSLLRMLDSAHEKLKKGQDLSSKDIAELWKRHKALPIESRATGQATSYYEKLVELLESSASNTQKSTAWARIRELFEECNQLPETPSAPILQSAITAYGRSGELDKCAKLVDQVKHLQGVSRGTFIETQYRLFEVYLREGKNKQALDVLRDIKSDLSEENLRKAVERMADGAARRNNIEILFRTMETTGISHIASNKHIARKVVDSMWKGQWLAITNMMCQNKKERDHMMANLRRLDVTKSEDFSLICQHIIVQALRSLEQSARRSMQLDPSSKEDRLMPRHCAQLFTIPRVGVLVELALTAFPKLRPPPQCLHDLLHLFAISGDTNVAESFYTILRKRKCIPVDKDKPPQLASAFDVSSSPLKTASDENTHTTTDGQHVRSGQTLNDIHSQQLAKALMHDLLASKQWDECLVMYGKMKTLNQDFAYRGDYGLLECAIIAYAAQKEWDSCSASLRQAAAHENNHLSTNWLKGVLNRMVYLYGQDRSHLSGSRIVRVMQTVEQTCNIQMDIMYTNALIRKLGEERDLQAARQLYMWVIQSQGKCTQGEPRVVNRSTFHAIMNAAVHNNDVDLALRAYVDLLHRWRPRLPLDKSESSMKTHQSQINHHLEPTLITYNILLNAYASRHPSPRFSQVYNLYRRMLVRQIEPDQVTFGTLAKAFSKADDQELVRSFINDKSKKPLTNRK